MHTLQGCGWKPNTATTICETRRMGAVGRRVQKYVLRLLQAGSDRALVVSIEAVL